MDEKVVDTKRFFSDADIAAYIVFQIQGGVDGTVNIKGYAPRVGYMVGGYVPSLVGHPELFDLDTVFDFLDIHRKMLKEDNAYVGWWTDNGKVYLDVSVRLMDREYATIQGRNNNEIAIWDLNNAQEIRL